MSVLPFQTLYFEDLSLGMTEVYRKVVSASDVVGFAELTGDRNPVHLSEHFAAKTPFKGRIAHGLYTASLISAVIGTRLPGPGARGFPATPSRVRARGGDRISTSRGRFVPPCRSNRSAVECGWSAARLRPATL